MFRKPDKRKQSEDRRQSSSSRRQRLDLDKSGSHSSSDETSKKEEECSKKIESSPSPMLNEGSFLSPLPKEESSPSPTPKEMYKSAREWLEPMTDEKGDILHFARLRPHSWAPQLAVLYDDHEINEAIQEINSSKSFGNVMGAYEKLRKLSRLAPRRLDVLQYCVEFSKEHRDIETMEGYLRCILELDPRDEAVKRDRSEILRSVDEKDNELFSTITDLFKRFKSRPSSSDDVNKRKAFRERLIYNTVAIEGNTMSLEKVRAVLNTDARIKGHSEREHLEVKGMDEALKMIEEKRKHGLFSTGTLTLQDILEIHKYVLLDWPENAGKLREVNVWITNVPFMPMESEYVEEEMKKVIEFINKKPPGMHPVEFAALVHYSFVYVHPFVDGNGRTCRILMNLAFEDYGFPDLIIPFAAGTKYFESLYFANMGDIRQFIRYIGELMMERLKVYIKKGKYSVVPTDEPPRTVTVDEKDFNTST